MDDIKYTQAGGTNSDRSRTSFDDMVRLDLRYLQRASVATDLKILLDTPRAIVGGDGAC